MKNNEILFPISPSLSQNDIFVQSHCKKSKILTFQKLLIILKICETFESF